PGSESAGRARPVAPPAGAHPASTNLTRAKVLGGRAARLGRPRTPTGNHTAFQQVSIWHVPCDEGLNHCNSKEGGPRMRNRTLMIGCLAAALAASGLGGGSAGRADEEARGPRDARRGRWETFLGRLRDFEDHCVSA